MSHYHGGWTKCIPSMKNNPYQGKIILIHHRRVLIITRL